MSPVENAMDRSTVLLLVVASVALALVAALAWGCYRLLVDRGRLLLRLEAVRPVVAPRVPRGMAPGSFLNDFALPALDGRVVTLSELIGPPLLLVVVQAECLFSRAFARELREQTREPDAPLPVLILSGEVQNPAVLTAFAGLPGWLVLDERGQMARLLRIPVTPAGYLVDGRRCTANHLLTGPETLLAAARGAMAQGESVLPTALTPLAEPTHHAAKRPRLGPGDTAPDFTLPLLTGGAWSLREQRGRPLTILFSDPGCPPCQRVLAKLTSIDHNRLVIVSQRGAAGAAPVAATTIAGASVVLQHGRETSRMFGMLQTPAAYAIDEAGIITAGPGVGVDAALAIIDRGRGTENGATGSRTVMDREE
jgi:hypothetical protein